MPIPDVFGLEAFSLETNRQKNQNIRLLFFNIAFLFLKNQCYTIISSECNTSLRENGVSSNGGKN